VRERINTHWLNGVFLGDAASKTVHFGLASVFVQSRQWREIVQAQQCQNVEKD
jgi:hypothetical protein